MESYNVLQIPIRTHPSQQHTLGAVEPQCHGLNTLEESIVIKTFGGVGGDLDFGNILFPKMLDKYCSLRRVLQLHADCSEKNNMFCLPQK